MFRTGQTRIRGTTVLSCIFSFLLGTSFMLLLVDPETCSTFSIRSKGSTNKYPKKDTNIFLVTIILSHPEAVQKRTVLRKSWLKIKTNEKCIHYFLLGTKYVTPEQNQTLQSEQRRFNDLILLPNIEDTYTELTKKVLDSFCWVDKLIDFKFLLKCDDDTFVNMEELVKELSSKPSTKLYWGFFDGRAQVFQSGQWSERQWFLCDRYLPYAKGGGYVLTSDVVHFISKNADLLQLYNSEDVSVGAWLAPLNILRIHEPRFDTEYKSRGCFNTYLITHKQSLKQIEEKYDNLIHSDRICRQEFRNKLSYNYNWSVPPSKCCDRFDPTIP